MLDDDEDAAPRFDPRFDPRFQRGYTAAEPGSPTAGSVAGAFEREHSREQNREHKTAGRATASRQSHLDPGTLGLESFGPEPLDPPEIVFGPGIPSTAWGSVVPGPVWSGRRWLITLWWVGALLLALGVVCLAYGIWANNDTVGQPYQDFWITVLSSVAWQVYGPTMTVGLATLVATGVLQALVPGLRARR